VWCVDASVEAYGPITLVVFHYDGSSWNQILKRSIDAGWEFRYAAGGRGAIWIVAPRYRSDGNPTVWKVGSTGEIEDHSSDFDAFPAMATPSIAAHDGAVFVAINSSIYRLNGAVFERLPPAGDHALLWRAFGREDAWACLPALPPSVDRLTHFDGVTWTVAPVTCSTSFAASNDGWNFDQPADGVRALVHYDGRSWQPAEPPPEPSAMPQPVRVGLTAIGNDRAGLFVLRHDSSSGATDFFGRTWNGSRLSQLQSFYHLDRYCMTGLYGECRGPLVFVADPLDDGTLVVEVDQSVFLGPPSEFR
jgi:hypothetical protein